MHVRHRIVHFALLLLIAGLAGCTVGPNYKRPAVDVPLAYRAASADTPAGDHLPAGQSVPQSTPTAPTPVRSFGDEKWWDVFQDDELQNLIRTAMKNNYDLRIAATRLLGKISPRH